MRRSIRSLRAGVFLAVLALALVPSVAPGGSISGASARSGAAACTAAGVYQVGPSFVPQVQQPPRSSGLSVGRTVTMARALPIMTPLWSLRGQLSITAYSRCGSPTRGTFMVRRTRLGPPVVHPTSGKPTPSMPCAMPCWPPTGTVMASGSFAADPAHGDNALYVRVDATITSTRPGPAMGRPCSTATGCPSPSVITSTVTLSGVTGYLQVTGTASWGTASLSFLPPPDGDSAAPPQALSLVGWRGAGAAPMPQSAPRP